MAICCASLRKRMATRRWGQCRACWATTAPTAPSKICTPRRASGRLPPRCWPSRRGRTPDRRCASPTAASRHRMRLATCRRTCASSPSRRPRCCLLRCWSNRYSRAKTSSICRASVTRRVTAAAQGTRRSARLSSSAGSVTARSLGLTASRWWFTTDRRRTFQPFPRTVSQLAGAIRSA